MSSSFSSYFTNTQLRQLADIFGYELSTYGFSEVGITVDSKADELVCMELYATTTEYVTAVMAKVTEFETQKPLTLAQVDLGDAISVPTPAGQVTFKQSATAARVAEHKLNRIRSDIARLTGLEYHTKQAKIY